MARYRGPKDRLSRREGMDLFGKGTKLSRLNIAPGVHGPKGTRRRPSQYGRQLREKQKVKRMYGVLEKQFRNYVEKAMKSKVNTADELSRLLETRLDNVVYRLGFAKTRSHARQLVGHGHVLVNGSKLDIPSYMTKVGDTVMLSKKAIETPVITKLLQKEEHQLVGWLQRKAAAGKVKSMPTSNDVVEEVSYQDIIEFYSR